MIDLGTERLILTSEAGVATLTFNNPAKRNAVSLDMWRGISVALNALDQDAGVRVLVLRGAGGHSFVSGADISEFEALRADAKGAAHYNQTSGAAWRALSGFTKPMIAAIQGFCLGGGLAIAMKADLRVATERSQFGIPAGKLGLAYPHDSMRDLVSLVGPAAAKSILFIGNTFGVVEAQGMGLLHEIVGDDAFDAAVDRLTTQIAGNAPLALAAAKQSINFIARGTDTAAESVERIAALAQTCMDSADYAEGRRAFMEKRRPLFTGR